jgi:hypothetical protein
MSRFGALASFTLLALVSVLAYATHGTQFRATPLFTIEYPPPRFALTDHGAVAFNDRYVFFGTDGGVFRAPRPLGRDTVPQLIAFPEAPVTALEYFDGALYAAFDVDLAPPGTRAFVRSHDEGATWIPLDGELEECNASCELLTVTQIELLRGRIFVNAGGNILVSGTDAASWNILYGASSTGKPQTQVCTNPAFAVVGDRLLMGGECPLDIAFLRTGTLRPDLLGWQEPPHPAVTPDLANRNVQFIRRRGESNVIYAGVEGGLLRSNDAGATYDFILRYAGDSAKYPYIEHILFPSTDPALVMVAGFDKAGFGPFLAVSTDGGATWSDHSAILPGLGLEAWSVAFLEETPEGQVVVGVEDDQNGRLHVFELARDSAPHRRRAARR